VDTMLASLHEMDACIRARMAVPARLAAMRAAVINSTQRLSVCPAMPRHTHTHALSLSLLTSPLGQAAGAQHGAGGAGVSAQQAAALQRSFQDFMEQQRTNK